MEQDQPINPTSRRSPLKLMLVIIGVVLIVGGGVWAYFTYLRPHDENVSVTNDNVNSNVALQNAPNDTTNVAPNTNGIVVQNDNSTTNATAPLANVNGAAVNSSTSDSNINGAITNADQTLQQFAAGDIELATYLCYLVQNQTSIQDVPAGHIRELLTNFSNGTIKMPNEPKYVCSQYTSQQLNAVAALLKVDSDQDGLPKLFEDVYATSDAKADTDGDGYTDLAEINSGYDPTYASGVTLETGNDPVAIDTYTFKCAQDRAITVQACIMSGVGF